MAFENSIRAKFNMTIFAGAPKPIGPHRWFLIAFVVQFSMHITWKSLYRYCSHDELIRWFLAFDLNLWALPIAVVMTTVFQKNDLAELKKTLRALTCGLLVAETTTLGVGPGMSEPEMHIIFLGLYLCLGIPICAFILFLAALVDSRGRNAMVERNHQVPPIRR